MSVIYKTLEKLRNSSEDEKADGVGSGRGKICSFPRGLFSPPVRGIAAGIVLILSGVLASYAAGFLGNRLSQDRQQPIVPRSGVTAHERVDGKQATQRSGWRAQYLRPESVKRLAARAGVAMETAPPSEAEHGACIEYEVEDLPEAYSSAEEPDDGTMSRSASGKALSPEESIVSHGEHTCLVKAKRRSDIAKLVSNITKSMSSQDMDHAKELIDELAQLKGEQDNYVLKLRAFWHMRQGDFEAPACLLTAVLEQEPDDVEAGINMAIVEVKTQRLQKARKRLARLREAYPANTIIEDLIQKIGR